MIAPSLMELSEKKSYAKSMSKNANIFRMFHTILYKAESPEYALLEFAGILKCISQIHTESKMFMNRGKSGIFVQLTNNPPEIRINLLAEESFGWP